MELPALLQQAQEAVNKGQLTSQQQQVRIATFSLLHCDCKSFYESISILLYRRTSNTTLHQLEPACLFFFHCSAGSAQIYQSEDHVLIGGELTMGIKSMLMKLLHVGLMFNERERERSSREV